MLNRIVHRNSAGSGALDEAREVDVRHTAHARATGRVQIVDVREPDEWQAGHVPGAIHIPLGALAARRGELDPARPVITVCRSGNRSLVALDVLRDAGITDAKSLAGGMIAWQAAGQPVAR
jgi:rhodanese-related sulfurtransferase